MLTNVKAGEIKCVEILCIKNKAGVGLGAKTPAAGSQWWFRGGASDATAILQLF